MRSPEPDVALASRSLVIEVEHSSRRLRIAPGPTGSCSIPADNPFAGRSCARRSDDDGDRPRADPGAVTTRDSR
jgi:hypothetical protein